MTTIPDELINTLLNARHIAVLTGAGISAESGIPTFRDAQTGFWARMKPEDLATPEAFERDPVTVWEWYAYRRELVAEAQPNAGHRALAAIARLAPQFTLVTQNVDSLHQKAGSLDVLELHGNISRVKCSREHTVIDRADWVQLEGETVPRCPHCNALLRPDVVWFGEMLPRVTFARAEQAFNNADVVFSIGTSGMVPPAATLPFNALERGAYGIEVNLNETYLSHLYDAELRGQAGVILPALVQAVWGDK